jgi:hypothetical protein
VVFSVQIIKVSCIYFYLDQFKNSQSILIKCPSLSQSINPPIPTNRLKVKFNAS